MNQRLPHIDILKGVAIILVVLYHLDRTRFCTGYLGVDIFFAVSGYFLLKDYALCNDGDGYGLRGMLRKRAGRLFPPLAVLLAVTLALSCGLCYYGDTLVAAETGLCALLGVANVYLDYCVGDYFSHEALHNPLVHLWFLSVLMQALLLFGALVRITRGVLRRAWERGALLALVAAASYALGHVAWDAGQPWGYYTTCSRLWEFALGGLAAWIFTGRESNGAWRVWTAATACGVLLLALVPGLLGSLADLAAVAAACVLVRTGDSLPGAASHCGRALGGLGRASYSVYLWHMPLIFFFKYLVERQPYSWDRIALIPLSLLLGYGMYLLVERRRWKQSAAWAAYGLVLVLHLAAVATRGGAEYLHRAAYAQAVNSDTYERTAYRGDALLHDFPAAELHNFREVRFAHTSLWKILFDRTGAAVEAESEIDLLGNPGGTPEFILIGDSHAGSLSYGFNSVGRERGWCGVFLNPYVIPAYADCEFEYRHRQAIPYKRSIASLLHWLNAHPELHTVVVAQNWGLRMECVSELMQAPPDQASQLLREAVIEYFRLLKSTGRRIVVLDDVPRFYSFNLSDLYRNLILGHPVPPQMVSREKEDVESRNRFFTELFAELLERGYCDAVLHQAPALERDGRYCAIIDRQIMMKDDNHLNALGAERAVRSFADEFQAILHRASESGK